MANSKIIDLSLFKEKIKPEELPALDISAYRIDARRNDETESMRKYACLGDGLSCCDYLYIKEDKAILIEDTHLGKKMKELKMNLKGFEDEEKQNKLFRAKTVLRQENCLKVYGARLILYLLSKKYKKICRELEGKKFSFWLVINDEDNVKAMDQEEVSGITGFLKEKLKDSLGGGLKGAKLVHETEVVFLDELRSKL